MVTWPGRAAAIGGLPSVQATLEGLKRTLARPKFCKEPNGGGSRSRPIPDRDQVVSNVSVGLCWVHALR